MRTFLRYFLPPVTPMIPFIALALWVAVDEARAPARMIEGHPDNAPLQAAGIILLMSPFIYAGLLFVQFLCLRFQRANFFTSYFIAFAVGSLVLGFHNIYSGRWIQLGSCAAICLGVISPMAFCSWLISRWITKPDAPRLP